MCLNSSGGENTDGGAKRRAPPLREFLFLNKKEAVRAVSPA